MGHAGTVFHNMIHQRLNQMNEWLDMTQMIMDKNDESLIGT